MSLRVFAERFLDDQPVLKQVPPGLRLDVWWRIALHRKCRFVYVRIPKAANSTISKTLALHAWPKRARWIEKHDAIWAKRQFGRFGLGTTPESLLQEYFCFSFFRNPYSRTLSAFLQKLGKRKFRWARRAAGVERLDQDGFSRFIDWLENGGLYADIHWAPQTLICPLPIPDLHFSGKVENLDQDLPRLIQQLFPGHDDLSLSIRQRDRQHAITKLHAFYDAALTERIYSLFVEDFQQLGYARDLPDPVSPQSIRVKPDRLPDRC